MEILAYDALLRLQQETQQDPVTGIAPVEEFTFLRTDYTFGSLDSQPDSVRLRESTSDTRAGKLPCEALYLLIQAATGVRPWWRLEIIVIIEALAEIGILADPSCLCRIQAMQALMLAPDISNPFYRYYDAFLFLTPNLLGRPLRYGEPDVPSPVECAIAMHVALSLRPHGFSSQVLRTIGSCCLYHSLWAPLEILHKAQDHILETLEYSKVDLRKEDVLAVHRRVSDLTQTHGRQWTQNAPSPDEEGISEREEILRNQVIRTLDVGEKIQELLHRGERLREAVSLKYAKELDSLEEEAD